MDQSNGVLKKLADLQSRTYRELVNARNRIRKKKHINAFEYALLFEDKTDEADKAGSDIKWLMDSFRAPSMPARLVLIRSENGDMTLCTAGFNAMTLCPNGAWMLLPHRALSWNDERPLGITDQSPVHREPLCYAVPPHRMNSPTAFIEIGEKEVADKLLPNKDRRGDRFDLFYSLTKKLEFSLELPAHLERIEREREETGTHCRKYLIELKALTDEIFFRDQIEDSGSRFHDNDAKSVLGRAKKLAQDMRNDLRRCELYEVDTEQSREIRAFGEKWITSFKL